MLTFPINIAWRQYAGSNPDALKKVAVHNYAADSVQNFINDRMTTEGSGVLVFEIHDIARALHLTVDLVCAVLETRGDDAITVVKA